MGFFATTTSLSVKMVGTTFDTATTSLASASIYDAENEIKKKLGKMYDFGASPFLTTTTLPPMITTMCEWLAIGYMYESMSRGSKEGYARADRYIKRVNENLKGLMEGDIQLLDASDELVTQSSSEWNVQSNTSDYSNTFNEDHPRSWAVDSDKLDDIESERS